MRKLLKLVLITCLFSCGKTNEKIVITHHWKGGCIGDWLKFSAEPNGKGLYLSNDTIIKQNRPVAVIDSVYYHFDHYVMALRSINTGQECLYFDKGTDQ